MQEVQWSEFPEVWILHWHCLVTAKAFDALGLERNGITAVTMPCFGTTDRTYQNACKMSLKARSNSQRSAESVRQLCSILKILDMTHEDHSVTYENSQARERTQVLDGHC